MALAHPTLQQEAREVLGCDYFIDAMDDSDFALKDRERAPSTLDEALRVALQLETWRRDARQRSDEAYHKPKVRGTVDDDSVSLAKRLDHLETDFSKRLHKLMKLQEAAICKPIRQPEVSVWEAPVVSLVEPNGAACSNIDVKLQSSQGCRGDGISIPIPIPYPQESPWESPWESPYPRNPK